MTVMMKLKKRQETNAADKRIAFSELFDEANVQWPVFGANILKSCVKRQVIDANILQ